MAAARHLLFSLVSAISLGVGRRALFQNKSRCKEICIRAFLLPFSIIFRATNLALRLTAPRT